MVRAEALPDDVEPVRPAAQALKHQRGVQASGRVVQPLVVGLAGQRTGSRSRPVLGVRVVGGVAGCRDDRGGPALPIRVGQAEPGSKTGRAEFLPREVLSAMRELDWPEPVADADVLQERDPAGAIRDLERPIVGASQQLATKADELRRGGAAPLDEVSEVSRPLPSSSPG